MSEPMDAIVVGGGLAGVTAARDLAQAGLRTLLVEARDRLGGRVATQKIAGREADTGGAYFHWFQSAIWREVMRYELPVVESALFGASQYLVGDGNGVAAMSVEQFDDRQRRALASFWGDPGFWAALPRPFAMQTEGAAAELDAVSVEDRLRQIELDPDDERVLRAIMGDFGPLDQVSLAWVLQRMANGVWSNEAYNALFAVYRLEHGMGSLVDAIVRDGEFEVRLSSPVTAIDTSGSDAVVMLQDGTEVSAKAVVVATPVNVWKSISFTPPLSEQHETASTTGVAIPTVSNVLMHVRGLLEPVVVLASFGDLPFDIVATQSMLDDGQLLHGISISGQVTCAGGHDQVARALRQVLPAAELVDFVGHDWSTDPYALGGWAVLRPGQVSRFLDVLDTPRGSLYFAGADIAPQFSGMLTGAIESGARAAQRAKQAIKVAAR